MINNVWGKLLYFSLEIFRDFSEQMSLENTASHTTSVFFHEMEKTLRNLFVS